MDDDQADQPCVDTAAPAAAGGRADPTEIGDLKPDPNNPRSISEDELAGLIESIDDFGDLSGIVWNRRTGQLVAGHQRIDALRRLYGDGLMIENGDVVTPSTDGAQPERFPVRVVDWPYRRQQLANIAANNPNIQGDFTPELQVILRDIAADEELAGLVTPLRIDSLMVAIPSDALPETPSEDGFADFADLADTEDEIPFLFGGYKGRVGADIYRSFRAAYEAHDPDDTGIIDTVLADWLGLERAAPALARPDDTGPETDVEIDAGGQDQDDEGS